MRAPMMLITALMLGSAAMAAPVTSWDGLTEVNSRRMDSAFLLPGADFRPYTKVMLDEPEVAFRHNWLRDVNRRSSVGRVTQADADRILATTATNTTDIFTEEFKRAGFDVVNRPGPNVLRVRIGIIDLFVNAPDVRSAGRSRTFTTNAGEATLVMETRDSQTNALLGRVLDRRETRGIPGQTNRVTNTSEFRTLARDWARISTGKLTALQAASPIPDPLAPGQRIK